jgi:hypothetical protein
MAFVFSPLGLIFGIVARRQIRQTGEDGDGLALAGLIIGGIFTALGIAAVALVIIALATGDTTATVSSMAVATTGL